MYGNTLRSTNVSGCQETSIRLTHIERFVIDVMEEAAEDRRAKGTARRLPEPIASVLSFHDTPQEIDLLSSHRGRERERGDVLTTFDPFAALLML